jgi:ABC-type transport system involved in multi-copper enzyme maturation permease subunit
MITIHPSIALTLSDLIMVGLFFLLSVFFVMTNLLLGFLISTLTSKPIHSLNLLLILWILMAIIVPSASWVFARNWIDVPSEANVRKQIYSEVRAIVGSEKYTLRWDSDWAGQPPNDFVRRRAAGKQAGAHHQLQKWHEYLQKRMNQTHLAIQLSKISPFGVFRFLGERLSDNGYFGYCRFYEQVRRYRSSFIDFASQKDQADPESHHLIWNETWSSRTFTSQKPVAYEEIPQFEYRYPTFMESWKSSQVDILILVFWCLILFAGTFVAFIQYDVR